MNTNASILLVDDDPGAVQLMSKMLDGVAALRFATSGVDALRRARQTPPDLILLDAEMPGMSGFAVCSALKADRELATIPVVIVTSHREQDFEVAGLEAGAADFISKPVNAALLQARVRTHLRLKRMTDDLRRIMTVDPLTGLTNRLGFAGLLEREWRRARRSGDALAVLAVDIDHFGRFNAQHGSAAGDAALRQVAHALLGASLRPADCPVRLGGDEFALLLPHTPRDGAEHVARRVLDAVEALAIEHADSPCSHRLTVSIGVGCYDEGSACWREPSPDSRIAALAASGCAAELAQAALEALAVARQAGGGHARLLDIGDFATPAASRAIGPAPRNDRLAAQGSLARPRAPAAWSARPT